jgi:TonB-dependent SusC/RagA subfamily outer membrane receptor
MIHSTVGRRGTVSALLALPVSALLIVLACETPTPPAAEDPDGLEQTLAVPAEVAQEGEGYFLVRKVGDQVEYVRSVPASELDRLEGEKVRPETDPAFVVQEVTTEAAQEAGSVIRLREQPGTGDEGDPIQPLIIVDGVITHSSLAELESEDIKSIEIVKGGAAEAMYGARAAGGVVLVTTKKGGNAP